MDLEIARNPSASPSSLNVLIDKYSINNRDLGEALVLNRSLNPLALKKLLEKVPLELQVLAIKHPNLSLEDQMRIVSIIDREELRTKARFLLLERDDLDYGILTVLCLDPEPHVREKAQNKLKGLKL